MTISGFACQEEDFNHDGSGDNHDSCQQAPAMQQAQHEVGNDDKCDQDTLTQRVSDACSIVTTKKKSLSQDISKWSKGTNQGCNEDEKKKSRAQVVLMDVSDR